MSLVDAIPQTIQRVGAAKARGLAGGGAWGNAVSDIGNLIGQIPAQMAAKKSRDMSLAIQSAEMAKVQREQAADTALQNATASALNPDGTLNTSLLTQHLAGTPAASRIPVILEQFNRMQETAANVRLKTIDAQEAEDDILGSLAHASAQAENPDDRAGILAAGLASAQRTGTVRPERAKDVLSSILTPDGKPDGTKVDALVKQLTAASKTQRTLAESEARASALNADRQAQEDVRTEQLRQTKLRNLSSQLGSATSQADYARRYQGIPEDMRGYFDAPDAWTPDTAQRALGVALTPAERLSIQTQDRLAKQAQATADRQAETDKRLEAAAAETARHNRAMENRPTGGAVSAAGADDVKLAVQAMKEGTVPPMLPGRASKEYMATMAEAKRQGYDLAKAATDWTATQKHIATMNGAQQLRLNQAINALPELLDSVDALASQWKGGRFPILNKANLALAKNGAFGQDVASVANRLDAQIADVVSDLGNVYMGGNSPTDHALSLAQKSLSSDWSEKVLHDMVKTAKDNVIIRRNSIANTGVAGASPDNPYAPPQQPVAVTPVAAPAPSGLPSYADYLKSKGK